jgi:uncharacterized protein with NRDE domain
MCLLLLSYRQHAGYPLVVAANRDEFYGRPTAPAAFWQDADGVFAGRDLMAGGTWMGVTVEGRFAAVTNYRQMGSVKPAAPSRGDLVAGYLKGHDAPLEYMQRLVPGADAYNGFNLVVGDPDGLVYFSNRGGAPRTLEPGLYGLSNHLLDTPWPKVVRGKAALRRVLEAPALEREAIFDFLSDETRASDDLLPDTGVGRDWERVLSSLFISSENYGTRLSTVVLLDAGGALTFAERTHPLNGASERTVFTTFQLKKPV